LAAAALLFAPLCVVSASDQGSGRTGVGEICAPILADLSHWGFVGALAEQVQERFPDHPIARALEFKRQLPAALTRNAVPFSIVPPRTVLRHGPRGKSRSARTPAWVVPSTAIGSWPSLRAIVDFELNTVRYVGVKDQFVSYSAFFDAELPGVLSEPYRFKQIQFRPFAKSKMVFSWTAGLTGVASNAGRVFNQIRLLNTDRQNGITGTHLRSGPNAVWFPLSAVTSDVPFHGAGSMSEDYLLLENSLQWRQKYYASLRVGTLPVVAGSRSGESLLLGAFNQRHPEALDAMVWMAPVHPTSGYAEGLKGYRDEVVALNVPINPLAFTWFAEMREQMMASADRWWERSDPTSGKPLLILVGENDKEVPELTRAAYRQWANQNPHIFYVEVPGAGHDVFSVTEDTDGNKRRWTAEAELRAAKAWGYVYWFLRTQVLKETLEPPAWGWLQKHVNAP
jgi:hypothetical protein